MVKMSVIAEGRVFALAIFTTITVLQIWLVEYAKTNELELKTMPAYEAIREAIGRAAEQDRPVMCHCGQRDLDNPFVAATLAGLEILSYVAKLCAQNGVKLIVPSMLQSAFPLQVQIVRDAYAEAGVPEEFDESNMRFLSPHHQAYAAGVIAIMERENVSSNIMVGQWSGITLVIAETSARLGCFGIGGTDQTSNMAFFIPTMDYAIIGEEMYSLGTYIEKSEKDLGTIFAKDIVKILMIALAGLGTLLGTVGVSLLSITGI